MRLDSKTGRQIRGHVSTPHVLAETSNFLDRAPPGWGSELIESFRQFVAEAGEIYDPATLLVARPEFHTLSGKIESMGGRIFNFNHYRSGSLMMEE